MIKLKPQIRRARPLPDWKGEDLAGKTIVLWPEQGIGDEIIYASMIPDVIARAKKCIVVCSDRLVPVFARAFPEAAVTTLSSLAAGFDLESIDYQSMLASLGQFLRPELAHFPHMLGYLKADAVRTAALRARYAADRPRPMVVGLSWRSRNAEHGHVKSADLAAWGELLSIPDVTFVNLQYGDCRADLAAVRNALGVDIVQDGEVDPLVSMDDFFAQVAAMDLVITSSNTTVHVAGSLNIPTVLLLPDGPGTPWYWFLGRTDSPWYPALAALREPFQSFNGDLAQRWAMLGKRAAGMLRGKMNIPR